MTPPSLDEEPNSKKGWWRLPLLLAAVLGGILIYRGGNDDRSTGDRRAGDASIHARKVDSAESEDAEGVVVTIDFGGEAPREVANIPWNHGMTVRDAMQIAAAREADLRIHQRGEGEMAFLTQIGPQQNEGPSGRNWIYKVNGKSADRSFAIQPIAPGDRVLWSFAKPE